MTGAGDNPPRWQALGVWAGLTLHGRFLLLELAATDSTVQTWAGDDLLARRAVVVKVLPDRV